MTDDRTPREHADGRDPWRWRHGMHQYQHRHQQVGTVRAPVLSRGACRGAVSRETRPAISRSPRLPRPSGAMRGRRPTRLAGRESPSPPRRGEQPFTAVAARTASRRADAAVTVRLPTLLTIRGRMPDTVVRDAQAVAERTGPQSSGTRRWLSDPAPSSARPSPDEAADSGRHDVVRSHRTPSAVLAEPGCRPTTAHDRVPTEVRPAACRVPIAPTHRHRRRPPETRSAGGARTARRSGARAARARSAVPRETPHASVGSNTAARTFVRAALRNQPSPPGRSTPAS